MGIWPSQSIQQVWFVNSAEKISAERVFTQIFGEEPATSQKNKIVTPANPLFGQATGSIGPVAAAVNVQPGRVDVILTGLETSEEMPVLDTANGVALLARNLKSVDLGQPVFRLAVVANVFHGAANDAEATAELLECTGVKVKAQNPTDVMFQVNSRCRLGGGRLVNRLLRYSVVTMQKFYINVGPQEVLASNVPASVSTSGLMLMLDINTVPDGVPLERDQQATIFESLMGEVLRLAEAKHVSALDSEALS